MDRLRRSFRTSLRRKRAFSSGNNLSGGKRQEEQARECVSQPPLHHHHQQQQHEQQSRSRSGVAGERGGDGGGKPQMWQMDENEVRKGTCRFAVKYLGCVEVFESRGMAVCEEAIKVLKSSKDKTMRASFHVSGDGLRLVDEDTKGLIVDQTIEKVSFCAPDRNFEHGFSYICRDGTTRRWMCHGFMAIADSGERLSHAVGCAFAICLEKKQQRDKASVTMSVDPDTSAFTRQGSFRQATLTERLADPQGIKPGHEKPPVNTKVENPWAVERPRASDLMLQRHTSFRGFNQLQASGNSPFKRQLSLRNPQQSQQWDSNQGNTMLVNNNMRDHLGSEDAFKTQNESSKASTNQPLDAAPDLKSKLSGLYETAVDQPCRAAFDLSSEWPKTECEEPLIIKDAVNSMCIELSQGLSLLSNTSESSGLNNRFMAPMNVTNNAFGQPHESFSLPFNPSQSAGQLPVLEESSDETANEESKREVKGKSSSDHKTEKTHNPWDFVPDQPSPGNTSNLLGNTNLRAVGVCNSSSGISSNSVTSGKANVFSDEDFSPSRVAEEDFAQGFESNFVKVPKVRSSHTGRLWSRREEEAAILDDPFDANWALTASEEATANRSNPFKDHVMINSNFGNFGSNFAT